MGYKISSLLRRGLNDLISFIILLILIISSAYAVFALWDNQRIYSEAQNIQNDMIKLKPKENPAPETNPFEDILAVNPDVRAWLSMENTNIDFPVLQSEDNLRYVNTDVYGNFSLAGSIFLDCRNSPDFSDKYNLLYGHHMAGGNMFGDLDKYRDEEFFRQNPRGKLQLPQGNYNLTSFAVLIVPASEPNIFSPHSWEWSYEGPLQFIKNKALYLSEDLLPGLEAQDPPRLLALSTCASDFTDARTVLICIMTPA